MIASAVLWAGLGVPVRNLERLGVDSMSIVFMRYFLTALIVGIYTLIKSPSGFKISVRDIHLFAANGILSLTMFTYFYFKTIAVSTLSVASVLMYTSPIFVMVISTVVFREKITVKKISALIMAFLGCALVSGVLGNAVEASAAAICFGLLSGLGYGLYTIFGGLLIKRGYKPLTILVYTFSFAAIGALAVLFVTGGISPAAYKPESCLWALIIAVLGTILPFLFYTVALKYMEGSKAAIVATVEPMISTAIGLFYGEKLTVFGVAGIALVLASVVIINIKSKET